MLTSLQCPFYHFNHMCGCEKEQNIRRMTCHDKVQILDLARRSFAIIITQPWILVELLQSLDSPPSSPASQCGNFTTGQYYVDITPGGGSSTTVLQGPVR